MPHVEDRIITSDGLSLFRQSWLPEKAVRADVVVVHGFAEHSGRYAWMAEQLNRHGAAVHMIDLRGHGRSDGPRCFVRRWNDYLSDVDVLVDAVRRNESGRPLILMGHSMGGLIATCWCIARQPQLDGLVLSAPELRLRADLHPWLRRVAGVAGWLTPWLRVVRMGFGNISRDPEVVARVRADPLVFHGRFPARTAAEMARAMRLAEAGRESIRPPLLVLHGTADRVCDPAGSRDLCRHAQSPTKTLHLYEGLYHEVLSEPERGQVMTDILNWLEKNCL